MKVFNMKFLTVAAVLLLVATSMTICGCTSNTNPTSKDTAAMNVTYKAVKVPQKYGSGTYAGETPKVGYKFIGYNVTLTNVNAKDKYVAYNDFELRDNSGNVYQYKGTTMVGVKTFGGYQTKPGDIINATIVFEVPNNVTLKSLTYNDGLTQIETVL